MATDTAQLGEGKAADQHRRLYWGSTLLAVAYLWSGLMPLLSIVHRGHPTQHHLAVDTAVTALALVAVEVLIVLIPLRRGETWAFFAALVPVLFLAIPRMLTDPTCTAMSLSVHGCHQFMAALFLAVVGLALARPNFQR